MTSFAWLVGTLLGWLSMAGIGYVCLLPFARKSDKALRWLRRVFVAGAALLVAVETLNWIATILSW